DATHDTLHCCAAVANAPVDDHDERAPSPAPAGTHTQRDNWRLLALGASQLGQRTGRLRADAAPGSNRTIWITHTAPDSFRSPREPDRDDRPTICHSKPSKRDQRRGCQRGRFAAGRLIVHRLTAEVGPVIMT